MKNVIILVFLLVIPRLSIASDETLQKLNRNPFQPPNLFTQLKPVPNSARKSAFELELRATMISEGWATANVNGQILLPGDRIQGYRLLKVRENEAIFIKNGKEIKVNMNENPAQ